MPLLAGCGGPLSSLEPAGPAAGSLAELWWAMLAGAMGLFALVMALLALAVRPPGWVTRVKPRLWLIWGGLALPALVLPPLVVWALVKGERLLPLPGQAVARIEVEAFRWGWTFRYPDHGGAETLGVLHLPAGQPVDLLITSRDVIHSFWAPRLAGKRDAIPGRVTVLRLQADAPGRLHGQCYEFCGLGHADMAFEVQAHDPEGYAAALAQEAR